jgi:hypothetical protein
MPENHYISGYDQSPSCPGMDNLATGGTLDVEVPSNGQRLNLMGAYCWTPEGSVTSDIGLRLTEADPPLLPDSGDQSDAPMFFATGSFTIGTCTGRWGFEAVDKVADAYNGTPAYKWVGRMIKPDWTPACQTAFPTLFSATFSYCHDDWDTDVQKL